MSTKSGSTPGNVFEVKKVRELIELMNEHDLAEIDLKQGDQRIRLRRPEATTFAATPAMLSAASFGAASAPSSGGEKTGAELAADESKFNVIKSPMVGTFYARPNPKAEPYVKVGDRVDTTTVVCIIEAMKVFNEIPAEIRGKVVAVLCEDGEAVEFDKPLFKVDTSG